MQSDKLQNAGDFGSQKTKAHAGGGGLASRRFMWGIHSHSGNDPIRSMRVRQLSGTPALIQVKVLFADGFYGRVEGIGRIEKYYRIPVHVVCNVR